MDWIDAKETKPDNSERVLLWCRPSFTTLSPWKDRFFYYVGYYIDDREFGGWNIPSPERVAFPAGEVLYWAKLPDEPIDTDSEE